MHNLISIVKSMDVVLAIRLFLKLSPALVDIVIKEAWPQLISNSFENQWRLKTFQREENIYLHVFSKFANTIDIKT